MRTQTTNAHPVPPHTGHNGPLKKIASLSGVFPVPLHRGQAMPGLATITLPLPLQAGQVSVLTEPSPLQVAQSTVVVGTAMIVHLCASLRRTLMT
jgi:hypothetical protein